MAELTAFPTGIRFHGNARGKSGLESQGCAVVQCGRDACKAETRTILEAPNRTIWNCVSAFENLGPNGSLLWQVLRRRAGQAPESTAHSNPGRLRHRINGAPRPPRAR